MNGESISIILFLLTLGILIFLDRKNIELKYGAIIRRTKKGRKIIRKLAKKYERSLKVFSNVSVGLAFIVSIIGFYLLLTIPGVRFMAPKIFPGKPSETVQRYVFFIPLWYWIIAVFVIMTPHELSHGLIAVVEKIKIKSLGVFLFLVFPGAFVEQDEEEFQKSEPLTRMRIASVGSIANLMVFLILMGMFISLIKLWPVIFEENGVEFENTIPGTPADDVNLEGVITRINDHEIRSVYDLSDALSSVKPGERIVIVTTKGEYELNTVKHPENASLPFIGIGNISTRIEYSRQFKSLGNPRTVVNVYEWVLDLLGWIAFLDINVAVANLLPFLPFDGGVIWQSLLEKFLDKKKAKKLTIILSVITYFVLFLKFNGVNLLRV